MKTYKDLMQFGHASTDERSFFLWTKRYPKTNEVTVGIDIHDAKTSKFLYDHEFMNSEELKNYMIGGF